MSVSVPPFAPAALRELLTESADMTEMVSADAITTREIPQPLAGPCVVLRVQSGIGEDPMLTRPLLQVTAICPEWSVLGGDVEPEVLAHQICSTAVVVARRAGQRNYNDWQWRCHRIINTPSSGVDTTRGHDMPLYLSTARIETKFWGPRPATP